MGFSQVGAKPPRREADVDFVRAGKHHVRERQARSAVGLLGLGNTAAEVGEQRRELELLLGVLGGGTIYRLPNKAEWDAFLRELDAMQRDISDGEMSKGAAWDAVVQAIGALKRES